MNVWHIRPTSSIGEAGEDSYKGLKRITQGSYLAGGMVRSFLNGQNGENEKSFASPTKAGMGQSQVTGPKSAKRSLIGEREQSKGTAAKMAMRKDGKTATAAVAEGSTTRSASRNAGAAIVNLNDYKKEKDVSTSTSSVSGQITPNRTVSEARNPNAEDAKTSEKPTAGTTNREKLPSSRRNPAARMESQKEVAATKEPVKHLTKWEAQKQIDARKTNSSSKTFKQSESRNPDSEE